MEEEEEEKKKRRRGKPKTKKVDDEDVVDDDDDETEDSEADDGWAGAAMATRRVTRSMGKGSLWGVGNGGTPSGQPQEVVVVDGGMETEKKVEKEKVVLWQPPAVSMMGFSSATASTTGRKKRKTRASSLVGKPESGNIDLTLSDCEEAEANGSAATPEGQEKKPDPQSNSGNLPFRVGELVLTPYGLGSISKLPDPNIEESHYVIILQWGFAADINTIWSPKVYLNKNAKLTRAIDIVLFEASSTNAEDSKDPVSSMSSSSSSSSASASASSSTAPGLVELIETESENDNTTTTVTTNTNTSIVPIKSRNRNTDSFVVTLADVGRLCPGLYLNDTIVDFYLSSVFDRLRKSNPLLARRVYITNSFFYTQIKKFKNKADVKGFSDSLVQKWSKNVDFFSKDFVIVPINEDTHWSVAILCFPANVPLFVEYFYKVSIDDMLPTIKQPPPTELPPRPAILLMDPSKGHQPRGISESFRKFLNHLWLLKHPEKGACDFNGRSLPLACANVPRQMNSWDCGVFVLEMVERFLNEKASVFTIPLENKKPGEFTKVFGPRWFSPTDVYQKRIAIDQLLKQKGYDEKKQGWKL